MKAWILAAAFAVATFSGAGAQTLAAVKQRGTLVCGVSQGVAGFSAPDSRGEYRGLDADYCRAAGRGGAGRRHQGALLAADRAGALHRAADPARSTC